MGTSINFDKILGYSKGCNIMLANLGTQLLLDLYPNAAVAYSLRKLRTAYTGSAIRVRRSVDNAEQDIAFSGNDLDTTSMLDFVGYNMWTYSEEFNNALYVKTNLNGTGTPPYIDVETAPDGTLTGDKIIENTTSGSHLFRRETGTIINGASYNISVYLKQGERTSVEVASQVSGTLQTCILDLTNGNISSNGFANTPVVTAEANGWYRFSVTITSGVTSQLTGIRISLRNALNQTSYAGDGTSGAYVWGTQLSQTSTVKTYQKTGATAGGNGFVSIWYDQSTNANNSTQTTPTNQAQIVLNGNLVLDPNTNKISTNWTGDHYQFTTGISPNTKYFLLNVLNRSTGAIYSIGNGTYSGSNGQFPFFWNSSGGGSSFFYCMPTIRNPAANTSTGAFIVTSEKNNTNQQLVYFNGVTTGTVFADAPALGSDLIYFGRSGTGTTTARFNEMIYWNSDQSANRTGIETNVNTYWNAY